MGELQGILTNFGLERGFDFGKYDTLARSQAVCPQGLIANTDLLQLLIGCSPKLEFSMTIFRKPITEVVNQKPRFNDTSYNNNIWSSLKAERILTTCNHLRRLAREPVRFKQAAAKCSGQELEQLTELVSLVEVDALEVTSRRNKAPMETARSSSAASKCTTRQLSKKDSMASNLSTDSQGFPKIDLEEMESTLASPKLSHPWTGGEGQAEEGQGEPASSGAVKTR